MFQTAIETPAVIFRVANQTECMHCLEACRLLQAVRWQNRQMRSCLRGYDWWRR